MEKEREERYMVLYELAKQWQDTLYNCTGEEDQEKLQQDLQMIENLLKDIRKNWKDAPER